MIHRNLAMVVLIVGLVFSALVSNGLTQIAISLRSMPTAPAQAPVVNPPSTIVLSDNRFAVVTTYSVQVLQVDASGHVRVVDWLNTQTLEPIKP